MLHLLRFESSAGPEPHLQGVWVFFLYIYKNWKYISENCLKKTTKDPKMIKPKTVCTCIHMHTCSFSARSTTNAEFALILRNLLLTLLHTHTYSNALPLVQIHPLPRWHIYSLSPSPLCLWAKLLYCGNCHQQFSPFAALSRSLCSGAVMMFNYLLDIFWDIFQVFAPMWYGTVMFLKTLPWT